MRILKYVVVSTVLLLATSHAYAQSLDDDTACGTVVNILEAPFPDKQRVKEVLDYTLQIMQAVDRLHGLKRQMEIFPQISKEGRSFVALIVTERCRSQHGLTLADTAIQTYEAIRTLRTSLGLNGERRKWARRTLAPYRLAPKVLGSKVAATRAENGFPGDGRWLGFGDGH
ncbi:MAG: hypothetical protein WBX25_01860 [Rhodomicrobium sp.]